MIFKAILTPAQGGQYGPVYPVMSKSLNKIPVDRKHACG